MPSIGIGINIGSSITSRLGSGNSNEPLGDIFFSSDGATTPWYAGATQPNSFYVAAANKTYVFYEQYFSTIGKRFTRVRAYNHTTGTWGRSYAVGAEGGISPNDDHSVPAACVNADGRFVVAWGNHDGDFHLSVSTNPYDETRWTAAADLSGAYTYPHFILMPDNSVNVLLRKNIAPGATYANGAKIFVKRTLTFSGTTTTIGAESEIGNLGDNSRWYQGNSYLRSDGYIHQIATRADFGDTVRLHHYYYKIDIANSTLINFAGTQTIAWPVGLTDMNTHFRIHATQAGDITQIASMDFDDTDRVHVSYQEGTNGGTAQPIYHMIGDAGSFSSPIDIGVIVGRDADAPRLIREAADNMGIYWPYDPIDTFTGGGNIYRKILPSGGSSNDFGESELIGSYDASRWPLNQVASVFNAHENLRMIYSEVALSPNDSNAGDKRLFAYGDNGHVRFQIVNSVANPTAFTGQGFWIDPSDLSTLFSDASGTIPASVNGTVRRILDKSGNGNHFTAQGSEFPTLRSEGGKYWLDFGDLISPTTYISCSNFTGVASNSFWTIMGFRHWMATSQSRSLMIGDQGSGNPRTLRLVVNGRTLRAAGFNAAGTGTTIDAATNNLPYAIDFTGGVRASGTTLQLYQDGSLAASGTISTGGINTANQSIRIGADQVPSGYHQGRFYGAIWRAGDPDSTIRNSDNDWLFSKFPS